MISLRVVGPNDKLGLGDEVLRVTADLHYLHVSTVLGRATVLGSLAAVEAHFGASGLRIHRSHWVARRSIRRVARTAGGWQCELQDGQRLPISRRRVAEVRALLGSDFVLEAL
jgi:DNA-binding LytR/AlgR family response regulator